MGLCGINFGSWLNPEGYILGGRNIAYHRIEQEFAAEYGKEELDYLNYQFRKNYIKEEDFARAAGWGLELIRIPFHYRLVESSPYTINEFGMGVLEWALDTAAEYGLKVILDLHAAPGSQSVDWHADSDGTAAFWDREDNRNRVCFLWNNIASRFKDKPALWGYDVLNEPAVYERPVELLLDFYRKAIVAVRTEDRDNKIFLQGSNWSQDIDLLEPLVEKNIGVSVHCYQPVEFAFNLRRGYSYPGIINGELWDRKKIESYLSKYKSFADRTGAEIFVGEFGVNFRKNSCGELDYLRDLVYAFNEIGVHWTYWTYKSVAQGSFPDGILQYEHNPSWICREGMLRGLETWQEQWKKNKQEIIQSFSSEEFTIQHQLVEILQSNIFIDDRL